MGCPHEVESSQHRHYKTYFEMLNSTLSLLIYPMDYGRKFVRIKDICHLIQDTREHFDKIKRQLVTCVEEKEERVASFIVFDGIINPL